MTGREKARGRSSRLRAKGTVRFRVHKIDDIKRAHPTWDTMTKEEKVVALRSVTPLYEEIITNVSTENGARHAVDKFDGQAVADVTHYAAGSGTTPPLITDTDLATRVSTILLTVTTDAGLKLESTAFWDTTEANGLTFAEGGLLAGGTPGEPGSGGVLLARELFAAAQVKDATKTFTVDHDLTFVPG